MPHIAPWFPQAKFGVFIHWLLTYPKRDPRPERRVAAFRRDCEREAARFTARRYDARAWARMFRSWGARYAVLTTKHHMGFALFDHPDSGFTSARHSPARRDIVREYTAALRDEGLKVGLYFSQPDWYHPDYASIAGAPDADPLKYAKKDDLPRWNRFVEHMFAEVRHLCTAYGKIDLLWFDGDWERTVEQWRNTELVEMIERLQPGIVINNRLRHACLGHYATPEQIVPLAPREGWWEQCMTIGNSWEYDAQEKTGKPVHELVRIFGDVVGLGGNLLLNVGAKLDGTFPAWQVQRMAGLGGWIRAHGEALYGADAGLPPGLFHGSSTHRGSVLYLIAYDRPQVELVVKGLRSRVARVTHLASGRTLPWRVSGGRPDFKVPGWLFIKLPAALVEPHATVVRVEFENDTLEVETPQGGRLHWRGRPVLKEQETYMARV